MRCEGGIDTGEQESPQPCFFNGWDLHQEEGKRLKFFLSNGSGKGMEIKQQLFCFQLCLPNFEAYTQI